MAKTHDGGLDGAGLKVGITVARFNEFVTQALLDGALRSLKALGVADDDVHVAWVPGAFELPFAGSSMAKELQLDAVIALGAVIQGETSHYDYVCYGVTEGVLKAGMNADVPFIFGVLTTDNSEQAVARAGEGPDNKGSEAALAAVEMAGLRAELRSSSR